MSPPAAVPLAQLGEIVGADNLTAESEPLARLEIDGLRPAVAVRPGSAEEVAEVIQFASAEKLAVVPVGAGTKLGMGAPPRRYDLAIEMTRLNRVLAYDAGDLTLSVGAGMRLSDAQRLLAEKGQFLPLLVPFYHQATIGGTVATNVDSPLRQAYGTARDFILGAELVTGEGARAKSGGRVVKNVAGYDLHKLMVGALGTLGIITSVNLKTFPVPPASRGFLAAFPTEAGALELRRRIVHSPLTPVTLDVFSPEVARIFARATPRTRESLPLPGPWLSTSQWSLAAGFSGNERVLERHARDLSRLAAEAGASSTFVLGEEERPSVWGRLREFVPLMLQSSPCATVLRIGLLPAQQRELLAATQQITKRRTVPCAVLARAVGTVYLALLPATEEASTVDRLAQACSELLQASRPCGGHGVIGWCPSELKRRVEIWGAPRDDLKLMQKLKRVFDPQGVLSPGRYLGGI